MFDLNPIGTVHSSLKNLEDCPRQENENAPEVTVEIFTEYSDAAVHIKTGDTLVLLTWLDRANRTVQKTHPRNNIELELTGVFSTRSPDRPNPIGVHTVRVLAVEDKNKIKVQLEVLDGTPIIDIKSN